MRFCWPHAYKLSRSDWNTEWSTGQFIILDVLQSSAYNDTQFPGITTSVKSLMKITKNKGPNKEPWGTPDGIAHHVEFIPSMKTLCSHSKRTGDTKITHFCSRILCATLSKAFAKFRKTTSTCLLSSKAFDHWWCDRTNWVKSYYNLDIYLAFHHVCQDLYIYKVYQTKVILVFM